MGLISIDPLVRGGSLALIGMWTWLLLRDHRQALAARVAILMNITICAHIIASRPGHYGPLDLMGLVLDTMSGTVIPLFWLFSRTWFNDETRIGWKSWAIALVPAAIVLSLDIDALGKPIEMNPVLFPILRTMWFIFIVAGLWTAWRGRADDLVEARRRLRLQLVIAVGIGALAVNFAEIAAFGFGAPFAARSWAEVLILVMAALLCGAMFSIKPGDLFASKARHSSVAPAGPDPGQHAVAERLVAHLETNKAWRDEGLTIAGLAAQLGEQEYRLRRLINGALGYRNFAQFLNGYRLAEVKAALADPSQRDVPILTIALDAGFGSLGPFNRAFREAEGMTPSEFRGRQN